METVKRMDQGRSTWKLLPLHPQPHWLKSLSSYIIRLAEANGFQSTDDLATLSGIWSWKYAHAALDYSAYCAEKVSEDCWMYLGYLMERDLLSSRASLCFSRSLCQRDASVFAGKHCYVFALLSSLFG